MTKSMITAALVVCLVTAVMAQPAIPMREKGRGPALFDRSGRIEITTGGQKLAFTRGSRGFSLTTYVKDGSQWREGFEAGQPLLAGPLFGDLPTGYSVLSNTATRKTVQFTGRHQQPAYDWSMRVSATAGDPLFHFSIHCRLLQPLLLDSPQPVVALWTRQGEPAVRVDQGPDSIYGTAGIPHGYGFPAAYLWRDGFEAAMFFDMTPMRWMQRSGVARFHDVRIMTRRDGDQVGLGMHFKRLSGRTIPAGDLEVDFHLFQGIRPGKPSALEALDTMVRLFAPLHPSSAPWPKDQITGRPASWQRVASHTIADLMKPATMAEVPAPWRDAPISLVPPQETMVVHPGTAQPGPQQVAAGWDFSTVNNHLTPWLLLARLQGDDKALQVALRKVNALPRFYDPRAGIIRHGTRQPEHVGDLEMCWQNLCFHEEVLRAASAAGPSDYNPAVVGRFLMAAAGLRKLAHNVDYVQPQWFDPYSKQPVAQNDLPKLGVIREPWQNGAYAHLMMSAYDITKDPAYLGEARQALDTLMERMRFRVKNQVYDRTYAEAGEFPITELFGNARGIAAAYQLYEATGKARYLRYSRDFLNTLLRLTPWYDDETDVVSRELHSAGLFFPHCGAHVVTPWETAEAHLMLVWALKHDPENPLRKLLLKLANLNRTNSFYFYPACWTQPVRAHDGTVRSGTGLYFPVEPFYSLEGEGGHRGPTAAYMASLGLWNDWMFEALAQASDPQIMALNLDAEDGYEAALSGIVRQFVVYNPTPSARTCTVRLGYLADGQYVVTIGTRTQSVAADRLRQGIPVSLGPAADVRLTVRRSDWREAMRLQRSRRESENAISHAYQALQDRVVAQQEDVRKFKEAMAELRAGHFIRARTLARELLGPSSNRTGPHSP